MKYEEQLLTQQWSRFREEILNSDRYKHPENSDNYGVAECNQCGVLETQAKLQIHHKQYRNGRKAWEYETGDVKILCSDCHEHLHGIAKQIEHWLIGLRHEDAEELLSLIQAIKATGNPRAISYCKNYAYTLRPADFAKPAEITTAAELVEQIMQEDWA